MNLKILQASENEWKSSYKNVATGLLIIIQSSVIYLQPIILLKSAVSEQDFTSAARKGQVSLVLFEKYSPAVSLKNPPHIPPPVKYTLGTISKGSKLRWVHL